MMSYDSMYIEVDFAMMNVIVIDKCCIDLI